MSDRDGVREDEVRGGGSLHLLEGGKLPPSGGWWGGGLLAHALVWPGGRGTSKTIGGLQGR